jgi:hypothetical protein
MSNWKTFGIPQAVHTNRPQDADRNEPTSDFNRSHVLPDNQPVDIRVVPTPIPNAFEVTALRNQETNLPMDLPRPPLSGGITIVHDEPAQESVPTGQHPGKRRLDTSTDVQRAHKNIAADRDKTPRPKKQFLTFHNVTFKDPHKGQEPNTRPRPRPHPDDRQLPSDTSSIPKFVPAHVYQESPLKTFEIDEFTPTDLHEELGNFIHSEPQMPQQLPVQPIVPPQSRTLEVPSASGPMGTQADELVAIAKGISPKSQLGRRLNECESVGDVATVIESVNGNQLRPIKTHLRNVRDESPGSAGLLLLAYLFSRYSDYDVLLAMPTLPKTWPTGWGEELRLRLQQAWKQPPRIGSDPAVYQQVATELARLYGI